MEKKEVYLVDDSADHRLVVRAIFKEFLPNYHLRCFQGARELYQYMVLQSGPEFKGRRPGLIILDLLMPSIDGSELLRLLRKTPDNQVTSWAHIPVVILSSSDVDADILKSYNMGANSYVTKPIDFEELKTMLYHICHYWIDFNVLPSPQPPIPIGFEAEAADV